MQARSIEIPPAVLSPRLLRLAGAYYLLCGLSAMLWPQSWYWACGLVIPGGDVLLATIGALMLALAYGAWQTLSHPESEPLILRTLLVANLADLVTVLVALLRGQLPTPNALIFIAVAATWCYFINGAIAKHKRTP